jgi:hypothetical protein
MLRTLLFAISVFALFAAQAVGQSDQSDAPGAWYETEVMNEGLGALPEDLDRATPQGAMEIFLDNTDRGYFAVAAHIMNLNDIEPSRQTERGPRHTPPLHGAQPPGGDLDEGAVRPARLNSIVRNLHLLGPTALHDAERDV